MEQNVTIKIPGDWMEGLPREELALQQIFRLGVARYKFERAIQLYRDGVGSIIYAWALLNNHAHILLLSGPCGLPAYMRRLLTSYAISFNRRHHRHGHLFQNRYKSIVCEEDPYFRTLVRYIHLNPLRAGDVKSMDELV